MPTNCQFALARDPPIYYSGEQIDGSISVSSTKTLQLKAIKLSLVGTGRVDWMEKSKNLQCEQHDITHAENSVHYQGTQEYLHETIKLAEHTTLQPDDHFAADFCFTVPERSAATCRQQNGEVAYALNLILQRKSTFNKICKQTIVIKNRLNLNDEPWLCEERCLVGQELEFSLPYTGFVPGQRISYRLASTSCAVAAKLAECAKISCQLYQRFTYRSQLPVLHTKEVLKSLDRDKCKIAPHTFGLLYEGRLCIPLAVPISTTNPTHLIGVSYYVEAVVYNARNRIVQKLIVPITVGTVALASATPVAETHYTRFCYDNLATTEGVLNIPVDLDEEPQALDISKELRFQKNTKQICDEVTLLPLQEIEMHPRRFSNF